VKLRQGRLGLRLPAGQNLLVENVLRKRDKNCSLCNYD
jgi:hypothetical protein